MWATSLTSGCPDGREHRRCRTCAAARNRWRLDVDMSAPDTVTLQEFRRLRGLDTAG
jgi:hypothetical protein